MSFISWQSRFNSYHNNKHGSVLCEQIDFVLSKSRAHNYFCMYYVLIISFITITCENLQCFFINVSIDYCCETFGK